MADAVPFQTKIENTVNKVKIGTIQGANQDYTYLTLGDDTK